MTLPPLIQATLKQLQQEHGAQAQAATRTVERQVGQTLLASVTETSPLTDAERHQVLQRLQRELATHEAKTGTHDAPTRQQLNDWIKQPQLNLVGLKAGGKHFYALTPETLKLQQLVEVLVRKDGQLQLQAASHSRSERPTAVTDTATTIAARVQAQWQNIAASLRSNLPHQISIKALTHLLVNLEAEITRLPRQQQDAILSPVVRRALAGIPQLSHTPAQLGQPETLQQAIRQSGVLLEAALSKALQPQQSPDGQTRHNRTSAAQLLADLQNPLSRQSRQAATSPETKLPLQEADTKAALLYALKTLQNHQISAVQPAPGRPASGTDSLVFSLLKLVQQMPAREKGFVSMRNQLLQSIQQQVAGALAKIQTQQLQSLGQRMGETGAPSQGISMELPVRLPDGYTSIGIHLQEYWAQESPDRDTQANERGEEDKKVRQWEVMLEFDLGDYGQLASQLKVRQSSVSANFWAEREATRTQAEEKLADLRAEMEQSGLQVKDIRCLPGQPPQKIVKFNYNLVDIRT